MLKTLFCSTCLIVTVFWTTHVANAISMTDVITGPTYLDGRGHSGPKAITILHDITDNGFVPGNNKLNKGMVKITFDDDTCPTCSQIIDSTESVRVIIGATTYGPWEIDHVDMFTLPLDQIAIADLNANGILPVKVELTHSGDFFFVRSEMTAHAPEPSTLVLLGSGLAGVIGFGLRRRNKDARA
jgi:hypothetical protein